MPKKTHKMRKQDEIMEMITELLKSDLNTSQIHFIKGLKKILQTLRHVNGEAS